MSKLIELLEELYREGLQNNSGYDLHDSSKFREALFDTWPHIYKKLKAAEELREAWNNAGPRPDIHEQAKQNLKIEWPALYKALADYDNKIKDL